MQDVLNSAPAGQYRELGEFVRASSARTLWVRSAFDDLVIIVIHELLPGSLRKSEFGRFDHLFSATPSKAVHYPGGVTGRM